ncbi:hypothetical protein A6R68_15699, partial [Neotoma lepida]
MLGGCFEIPSDFYCSTQSQSTGLGFTYTEQEEAILAGKYCSKFKLSPELWNVIDRLLTVNPEERPRINDIMGFPWLKHGNEDSANSFRENDDNDDRYPDPTVILRMLGMGYKQQEVMDALREKKYDQDPTITSLEGFLHEVFEEGMDVTLISELRSLSLLRMLALAVVVGLNSVVTFHSPSDISEAGSTYWCQNTGGFFVASTRKETERATENSAASDLAAPS